MDLPEPMRLAASASMDAVAMPKENTMANTDKSLFIAIS
jgi:hypothetical protein